MTIKDTIIFAIIPIAFLIFQTIIEFTLDDQTLSTLHSENFLHETLEFLIIGSGFFVGLGLLKRKPWKHSIWLSAWIGIATLACLYIAGEEISWGQHILNWDTPEYWKALNDQQETNLHNTSSWLDQKPRLILEIGTLVGGLIIPLMKRIKPSLLPEKFSIIYPDARFIVITLCALAIKITDDFMARGSEVLELYLFYFVLVYLCTLYPRISKSSNA